MVGSSILESLYALRHVKNQGLRLADAAGKLRYLSYAELTAAATRFAGGLLQLGVHQGEPVILVMTDPESAIVAILGCMIASCPPTPVYPPVSVNAVPGFLRFIHHVADRAHAVLVVADRQPYMFLGNVPHEAATVQKVLKFETVMEGAIPLEFSGQTENPIAFLQFTSGSTSTPKGVMVTHDGLAANLRMIREASRMDERSCVVTWLPVYHDMGLIGTVLNAITLPCELVVLPPMLFLKKPRLWLELITRHKGTHTAAPNFAYGLCVRRISNVAGLDLTSMTTFICGAEPVLPGTMEAFVDHFGKTGLRPEAMVPAYGLAEATLAVTFTPHLRGMATDAVDRDLLSTGSATQPTGDSHTFRIASCGLPMDGLKVRIADENDSELPERTVGEIQILGNTVTPGYVGDEEASRGSFTASGWLRTGDLGYVANGELYPCGRTKDTIIIRGKNFHAHDLENVVSEVKGVRTGNVAAFSVDKAEGDALIVIAETRTEGPHNALSGAIRNHMAQTIGITPEEIVIVPAGTLPKTSSGKLKRTEARDQYLSRGLIQASDRLAVVRAALKSGIGFLKK